MDRTLVVVPHYGPDALLAGLLRSVGVAAGQTLGPGASTLERGPTTFFIVNNNVENRGFTAACNHGLRHAVSGGFPFVWLLNNDTEFESPAQFESALEGLQALARSRDWGIVGQQVRDAGDRDRIVFGGALDCFPAGRHRSGLFSRGDWAEPSEEKWLSFCSVLLRRDVIDAVGPLDEELVTYYSDSDYSLRARARGFRLGYAGCGSVVFHKLGQSSAPGLEQARVIRADYLKFWSKWIAGERHASYLKLMETSWYEPKLLMQNICLDAELRAWLRGLPGDVRLGLGSILDHFQHRNPPSRFSTLCNVTRELLRSS